MRKESVIIFSLALVFSIGIVGALHYFYLKKMDALLTSSSAVSAKTPQSTDNQAPIPASRVTSAPMRTSRIQECIATDGSVTYTDQASCMNAEPNSTLSVVDTVVAPSTTPTNQSVRLLDYKTQH